MIVVGFLALSESVFVFDFVVFVVVVVGVCGGSKKVRNFGEMENVRRAVQSGVCGGFGSSCRSAGGCRWWVWEFLNERSLERREGMLACGFPWAVMVVNVRCRVFWSFG